MTKSNSWEVLWSPCNPNKFIKFDTTDVSSDIFLYQVYRKESDLPATVNKNEIVQLADDIHVRNIATNSEFSSIKSVSWCPKKDLSEYCVLATGLSNGRVTVHSIGSEVPSNLKIVLNQEFHPKMERACNDLAWNDAEPNLLAVALDKVRYDNSLTVWDIEAKDSHMSGSEHHYRSESLTKQPIFAHGSAEPTVSIQWLPHMPKTLVAGVSKWIRLFDIRTQSQNPKVIAKTNAIYGVCVDPHSHNRIASFAKGPKGAVLVWDIRSYEKPLVTLNQTNPVSKVLWCPRRNHMISVLQKDSNSVKYYDLQYIFTEKGLAMQHDEEQSILFERNAQLPKSTQSNISSYSWHPSVENTLLAISNNGNLHHLKIFEYITLSWSPSFDLMWGCGRHMFLNENTNSSIQEDISYIMRERAVMGYGEPAVVIRVYSWISCVAPSNLHVFTSYCIILRLCIYLMVKMKDEKKFKQVLNDPHLCRLWGWLKRSKKLKEHDTRKIRKFYGVKSIIKGDLNTLDTVQKRKTLEKPTKGNEGPIQSVLESKSSCESGLIASQYSSEDRKLALFLCEWDLTESALKERLDRLVANGAPERAAAMALFHNKLNWTIGILSGAQNSPKNNFDSSLPIVAMALSGYSENRQGSTWMNNCKRLSQQLGNPYLRAMFAFLTTEDEDFTNVLKENGMDLKDRIAFACRYLSDTKLTNYVENVTTSLVTSGGLEGLLLTGLTSDGIDLLENYITKYSDVQTAVLIVLTMKFSDAMKDPRVINWIENYRDLLDQWRLWHKRAQFDSLVQSSGNQRKIMNQINVTCTYCSKPVSSNVTSGGLRMGRFPHGGVGRQNKAMSCPGCRQPLPRCSICLINMGSLSSHVPKTGSKLKLESIVNVNSFQNWFTWCQICRHGGHAAHLAEWFTEHVECPVTGCFCSCNALDSVAMVTSHETNKKEVLQEQR